MNKVATAVCSSGWRAAYVSIVQSLQTCKFCVFVHVRGLLEVCIT